MWKQAQRDKDTCLGPSGGGRWDLGFRLEMTRFKACVPNHKAILPFCSLGLCQGERAETVLEEIKSNSSWGHLGGAVC